MNDADGMCRPGGFCERDPDAPRLAGSLSLSLREMDFKGNPFQEVHHQSEAVVELEHLADADHAGMGDTLQELRFASEALQLGRHPVAHQLHGDPLAGLRVARGEHAPHGAHADGLFEKPAPVQSASPRLPGR